MVEAGEHKCVTWLGERILIGWEQNVDISVRDLSTQ
jgi:hypothetical protein